MDISPEEYLAKKVRWQFFATLTFKGIVPRESVKKKMLHAWLRWFEVLEHDKGSGAATGSGRSPVLWMVREELGEASGRFHYHALLGGLSQKLVNVRTAMASCKRWEQLHGGMARNFVYDPHCDGVAYVLKGLSPSSDEAARFGAINYEMGKFNGVEGRRVLLGHSLTWKLLQRTSHKRQVTARMMRVLNRGS